MNVPTRPRTYLILPSLQFPFRRRSTTHEPPTSSPSTNDILSGSPASQPPSSICRARPDVLCCVHCATEFALASQIVSKGFTGRLGRAYLVSPPQNPSPFSSSRSNQSTAIDTNVSDYNDTKDLWNVRIGRSEGRALVTGWHEVADITCRTCAETVGWKYVDATDDSQKYKVGKFILETVQTIRRSSWEDYGSGDIIITTSSVVNPNSKTKMSDMKEEGNETKETPECNETDKGQRIIKEREKRIIPWDQGISDNGTVVAVVDFDSEDDDECDEIFSGTWDPVEVAQRRKNPRPLYKFS